MCCFFNVFLHARGSRSLTRPGMIPLLSHTHIHEFLQGNLLMYYEKEPWRDVQAAVPRSNTNTGSRQHEDALARH